MNSNLVYVTNKNKWKIKILILGFDLPNWLEDFDFDLDGDTLEDYMIEVFFREFGIASYLLQEQCNKALAPFADSTDGLASGNITAKLIFYLIILSI